MKKIIMFLTICLTFSMVAEVPAYDADKYYEKVIVACFEWDAIGNRESVLDYEITDGIVTTGISSFDALAQEFRFTDVQQTIDFVKDLDWNDNGIYPRCIYRIYLEHNDNIEEAIAELQKDPNIIFAEYDPILRIAYEPNDPSYSNQWHHEYIKSELAWDYTTGDDEIVIGIVDSGIMWNHNDLQDNIWVNEAELNSTSGGNPMTINWANGTVSGGNGLDDDGNGKIDDCIGWNFYGSQSNQSYQSYADNDHGTHVAGCAGAVGDNFIGVVGSIMNVKLISSRHAPTNTSSSSIYYGNNGIYYCADSGADIINCSWGGSGGGAASNTAVNYAVAQGSMVVCAAGNDALDIGIYPHYPGNATNAVCVAATGPNSDQKANFSNYGDPVDVSAPGDNIYSTIIANNGYASYGGTSMASPVAAGVAALIKTLHPDLDPMALKQRLEDTCDNIDAVNPDYVGMLGAGRINSFTGCMYDLIPDLHITDYSFFEQTGDGDGLPNPGEIVNLMLEITNTPDWFVAFGVSATISTTNPDVTFLSDTITFPDLTGGDTVWNTSSPFSFETPSDISSYELPLTITFNANDTFDYPYEVDRELTIELTLVQAGWPVSVGGASASAGVIVDLEDDGDKEIIYGDQMGMLHVMNADGTEVIDAIDTGGIITGAVAIGKIDGDEIEDMVIANEAGHVIAYDYNGGTIFDYDCGGSIKGTPMISDVDGDGINEVVAATFIGGQAHVIKNDGTSFANFPAALSGGMLSSPAIGDLNADGNMDIVIATLTGSLDVIDTSTGAQLAGWPYALGMGSWHGPIVANVDSDDEPEVLVGTLGSMFFVINHDGTLLSETNIGNQIKTSIVTSDFDNDGIDDAAFVTANGKVFVVDNQGTPFTNFPVDLGVSVESTPLLADMDDNGTQDIVFGDNSGYLHSIDITGSETVGFPVNLGSTIKTSAAIADTDSDGDIEILVPNQTAYVLVDYKNPTGYVSWANYKRNPRRTGNAYDATTGTNPHNIPTLVDMLGGNYPNPFNPTTNINYSLAEDGLVQIDIFNVKGQLVKHLVSEHQSSGNHLITWNGKDDNNKSVGSGIYFYKMRAGGRYTSTRKMIMLK
ncbi:MAG: S8 family serine peptidase [Candidatus Cloacimonetes bacterium]|nr:S8 family serine peptidase [Candidatus Cloacimonadota bacterium]MCF7813057.1 S8 family serine peptidase [Candidatus Cloacimonadota bacterium]MCF7867202.1 S8 family serine peptidase [Candidatus Cloacimonadota bacterium]MCF7882646.1 S8 family serine peptidase [Candidatus Cloacimonadota bacterium]